jgi:hypothetical protein
MKTKFLFFSALCASGIAANAQLGFNPHIDFTVESDTVIVPTSILN